MKSPTKKDNINSKLAIPLIVALLFPLISSNPYYLNMIIMGEVYAVLTMGWVLILRMGEFSLGQMGFFAIGAYSSALLVKEASFSFWIAMPVAGLITAIFAFLIGSVTLKIKGLYFAIITFALGEIIRLIITSWPGLLGGFNGITGIPKPDSIALPFLGKIDFYTSRIPFYYLILLIIAITSIVLWRLDNSKFGRIFRCIAMSDILAESVGIDLKRYKVMAFVIACFFAGIAGSFYAHYNCLLHPDYFTAWQSILIQIEATVGGTASMVFGPIAGAMALTIIGEFLRSAKNMEPILYGGAVILIMFFLPGGIVDLIPRLRLVIKSLKG